MSVTDNMPHEPNSNAQTNVHAYLIKKITIPETSRNSVQKKHKEEINLHISVAFHFAFSSSDLVLYPAIRFAAFIL